MLFTPTETLDAYFQAAKTLFLKTGVPLEMYTDRFSVFEVMRKNPSPEEISLTQFERALKELDVKLIKAKSPEAKGKVERVNRTFQDRLVKELRLQGVSDIASANAFVANGEYLKKHNAKFSVPAFKKGMVFRSLTANQRDALDRILSRNYTRIVQKDLSFQYEREIYQIYLKDSGTKLRGREITVWKDVENKVHAEFQGKKLEIHSMKEIEYFTHTPTKEQLIESWKIKKYYKPNRLHPYKKLFKQNKKF